MPSPTYDAMAATKIHLWYNDGNTDGEKPVPVDCDCFIGEDHDDEIEFSIEQWVPILEYREGVVVIPRDALSRLATANPDHTLARLASEWLYEESWQSWNDGGYRVMEAEQISDKYTFETSRITAPDGSQQND